MLRRTTPLTDLQIRNAKSKEKDYKLSDGRGLYLLVTTTGGKLWRFNYRIGGKQKTLAHGTYPEKSLAEARTDNEEARKLVSKEIDPGDAKKALRVKESERRANTFEKLAREWHKQREGTLSAKTMVKTMGFLERNVFSTIGDTPLSEISPRLILENVLRPIEARGAIVLIGM